MNLKAKDQQDKHFVKIRGKEKLAKLGIYMLIANRNFICQRKDVRHRNIHMAKF